jgi:hypothetical protein
VAGDGAPYHLRLEADVTQGPAPLPVTFDALTVISGDPAIADGAVCLLEFEPGTIDAARAWPCDANRTPIVERTGLAHTHASPGTYTATLLVDQPPWLVDDGIASVEVDIVVR